MFICQRSASAFYAGLFALCLWPLATVAAEEDRRAADLEGESQPPISIHAPAESTIEEYRVNGKLYMIRITPKKGAPYYLVDADGDGNLETRRNELAPDFLIPSWVIFKW